MDHAYRLLGVSSAVIDAGGHVLVASGWQDICTKFHRQHPKTNANCLESDTELSKGITKGTFKLYKCRNNLWDAATPIMIDGRVVGNVFCGQFFIKDDCPRDLLKQFRSQAKRYGFNATEYIEAFNRVPSFDREYVSHVIHFYSELANLIAEMGNSNRRQRQLLDEQRVMLQRMRDHEKDIHSLIASIPGVVYRCVNDADWTMKYLSAEIENLTGYPASDFIDNAARSFNSVIVAEDREKVQCAVQSALSERTATDIEYRLLHQDGSVRWVHERFCGYFENGVLRHLDGVMINVTGQRAAEENVLRMNRELQKALDELRGAQKRLIDQERRHALTTMANGIAHDFNNALAIIQGYCDLLLNHADMLTDQNATRNYVEHIQKAAQNAAATVRNMRKFYRPRDAGSQRELDLNQVIREALDMSRPRWQEQARAENAEIALNAELEPLPLMLGNEAELHDMLTNLIFNAVEAMPRGGSLWVKTHVQGDAIHLRIADAGVGMSDTVQNSCFNPFYSFGKKNGSGLGLSIVQGVVERHRGEISLESAQDQGTTINVSFPVSRITSDPQPAETGKGVKAPPSGRTVSRILVVEDDPVQADLLQRILSYEHYQVDCAADGAGALAKVKNTTYDLVVTDRAMPGMSGDEVASEIRGIHPGIPIIMLTGFGDIMVSASEAPHHVDKLLPKPYKVEDLCREVKALL